MRQMFNNGRVVTVPDELYEMWQSERSWIGVDMERSGRDFTALFGESGTYENALREQYRERLAEDANRQLDRIITEYLSATEAKTEIGTAMERNSMERNYIDFDEWIAAIRAGSIGKQTGNTRQSWQYIETTGNFNQINTGTELKTYTLAEMMHAFSSMDRLLWIDGEVSQQNKKRKNMYKYRLNPKYDLNYYLRRYRGYPEDLISHIYRNPGTITNETALDLGRYRISIKVSQPIPERSSLIDFYSTDLVLIETPLDEGMTWSNTRRRTLQFSGDHLLEQIRTRYAFFERPTNGLSNIIIDNYAPKLMYNTKFNPTALAQMNLPKTIYAISPWFAQYFGAQQVPTEQLCRMLGFDVATLKQMITKIKHKQYSITFVGYGGTNVNTIHWLTEIMKLTQSVNLFKFIEVYEPDTAEISNLLRFPKNPYIENLRSSSTHVNPTSKLKLLDPAELGLLSKEKPVLVPGRIDGRNLPYNSKGTFYDYNRTVRKSLPKDNHIYYGAPNIETRASFEDVGHFISATHNGNDAHLWLNPTQDTDLQVESYGLIQLTPFFMNQLRLAIGLMETLCIDDLDLTAKDQCLLEYSFNGIPQLSTNKTYNFQLGEHNGNVATETEAAQIW